MLQIIMTYIKQPFLLPRAYSWLIYLSLAMMNANISVSLTLSSARFLKQLIEARFTAINGLSYSA